MPAGRLVLTLMLIARPHIHPGLAIPMIFPPEVADQVADALMNPNRASVMVMRRSS